MCKAIAVDVEQDKAVEVRSIRAVEEIAGAYARLEMIGREIGAIVVKQLARRAAPGDMVRKPMHQHVVYGEHRRRVDRMCLRNRLVECIGVPLGEVISHAATYSF